MSPEVAEREVQALAKEVKQSLDRLQVLRGNVNKGKRSAPDDPTWQDLDEALKKAEGPLTGAFRSLRDA